MSLGNGVSLPLQFFSGIWHVVNGCGKIKRALNVVWLSLGNIPFYWALLPVYYYEDDFLLNYTV